MDRDNARRQRLESSAEQQQEKQKELVALYCKAAIQAMSLAALSSSKEQRKKNVEDALKTIMQNLVTDATTRLQAEVATLRSTINMLLDKEEDLPCVRTMKQD
jgi:hypothetical protein